MGTPAATLLEAASLVPTNLPPLWVADTLEAKMVSFAGDLYEDFPDDVGNNQPIANWLAVIGSFAPTILDFTQETLGTTTTGLNTIQTYETASDYIYRLFKFADYYHGAGFISDDQRDALLAAYNARFA